MTLPGSFGSANPPAGTLASAGVATPLYIEPGELRREVAKVEDGKTADVAVTRDKKALTLKVEVTARDRQVERKTRRSL